MDEDIYASIAGLLEEAVVPASVRLLLAYESQIDRGGASRVAMHPSAQYVAFSAPDNIETSSHKLLPPAIILH